jgi:hypothetical protein
VHVPELDAVRLETLAKARLEFTPVVRPQDAGRAVPVNGALAEDVKESYPARRCACISESACPCVPREAIFHDKDVLEAVVHARKGALVARAVIYELGGPLRVLGGVDDMSGLYLLMYLMVRDVQEEYSFDDWVKSNKAVYDIFVKNNIPTKRRRVEGDEHDDEESDDNRDDTVINFNFQHWNRPIWRFCHLLFTA